MSAAGQTLGLSSPRVLIPFALVTIIWGSTWLVIKDQLGPVPAQWSIAYRFLIAAVAMGLYALSRGASFKVGRNGHLLAIAFAIPQFTLNFNFVYAAEAHVTSGLVAVVFALLLVPNSLFAWAFLGQKPSARFAVGSLIAVAGVALLFIQEMRSNPGNANEVLIGIALTIGGILCASISNVLQGTGPLRARPIPSMLAIGMAYASLANIAVAYAVSGPPVLEYRLGYFLGVAYLGLFGSAAAFAMYFAVIRAIGPGKAAYSSLLVPVLAMALSTIFEGYHWSMLAVAGGVLALVGLLVALRSARAAPSQASKSGPAPHQPAPTD